MKRLQCLYRPNKDKNYPWALKHPKVESPLALFKSRKDAMSWFLSLGYDAATWFQTDKKIWGGLVIAEKELRGNKEVIAYEFNVDKFDGGLEYDATAEELAIDTKTGLRNEKEASKNLKAVVDFKILKDPETYFPVDDDFKIERKKSAKDIEIEKLNKKLAELSALLSAKHVTDYEKELQELYKRLQDSDSDKEQLLKEIEELREKSEKLEKGATKEVIVEKEEVVLPVVSVVEDKIIEYAYVRDLPTEEQLKVLAIYARKMRSTVAQLDYTETSVEDVKAIEKNFRDVLEVAKALEKELKAEDLKELLAAIMYSLTKSVQEFDAKIIGKPEIANTAENCIYSVCSLNGNIKLAQKTSYVLFNDKHVGFVPKDQYHYAIFIGHDAQRQHFMVFQTPAEEQEVVKEVVPAERTESTVNWFAIFLLALSYGILITLVILLGIGIIPSL
ncbi:MAG3090 family protein [Mycoplasma sp. 4F]|uniref:MAG3090 family protein n=1 Tax=Mycoplasma sp. 4F TaxID=3401664 RepID=UPI003AB01E93